MRWHPDAVTALEEWGVLLNRAQWEALERYAGLLLERGNALNLIAEGDAGRLHDRHIFDSLTAVPLAVWEGKIVVDAGSGAGLPGVPLAIACPETHFLLVEHRRRRAAFLLHVVEALGLANAEVLHADVRDLARERGPVAEIVTARALAPTEKTLALVEGLLRPEGCVLIWQTASQWTREPTPKGWRAEWHPTPSRDETARGIRIVTREVCA